MISLPVLFNKSSTIHVDNWNEIEFGGSQHSLILFIVLQIALMQELQTNEERNLHRKELSRMSCSSNQYSIGSFRIS